MMVTIVTRENEFVKLQSIRNVMRTKELDVQEELGQLYYSGIYYQTSIAKSIIRA